MHILIILSYVFSVWMIVDAYKRGAQYWWKVIIFLPFGEVVYFLVVKMNDYTGNQGKYLSRCRACRYFMHFDEKEGVYCKATGRAALRNPLQANICMQYKKSSWL